MTGPEVPISRRPLVIRDIGRMRILAIIPTFLALSGCAGSPVGDAIAGPEKLAAQDDAYCESIGATKGTPTYTDCRLKVTQQREDKHNIVRGALLSQPDTNIVFVNPGTGRRF